MPDGEVRLGHSRSGFEVVIAMGIARAGAHRVLAIAVAVQAQLAGKIRALLQIGAVRVHRLVGPVRAGVAGLKRNMRPHARATKWDFPPPAGRSITTSPRVCV